MLTRPTGTIKGSKCKTIIKTEEVTSATSKTGGIRGIGYMRLLTTIASHQEAIEITVIMGVDTATRGPSSQTTIISSKKQRGSADSTGVSELREVAEPLKIKMITTLCLIRTTWTSQHIISATGGWIEGANVSTDLRVFIILS